MNCKHSLDFCRSFCFWIEHTHLRLNCINPINWRPCEAATCVNTTISTLLQFKALKIQTHHIIGTNYIHSYIRELIGDIVKKDSQITLLESTMYFTILRPKANGVKLVLTSKILLDAIMKLVSEKFRNKSAVGQMQEHMFTTIVGARLEQMNLDLLHPYK